MWIVKKIKASKQKFKSDIKLRISGASKVYLVDFDV